MDHSDKETRMTVSVVQFCMYRNWYVESLGDEKVTVNIATEVQGTAYFSHRNSGQIVQASTFMTFEVSQVPVGCEVHICCVN